VNEIRVGQKWDGETEAIRRKISENVLGDPNQLENLTLEDTISEIWHGRGNDTPMKTIHGVIDFMPIQHENGFARGK
jgi:hypothetical protein